MDELDKHFGPRYSDGLVDHVVGVVQREIEFIAQDERRVLGIDQSLTSTGYCVMTGVGVISSYGTIRTQSATAKKQVKGVNSFATADDRIYYITENLRNMIGDNRITHVNIEGVSYASGGNAGKTLAMLFGTVNYMIRKFYPDVHITQTPPNSLKKFAQSMTGVKTQGKEENADGVNVAIDSKPRMLEAARIYFGDDFAREYLKSNGLEDVVDAAWLALHGFKGD